MKKIFDFFIFSNLYIACASLAMCSGTLHFFHQQFNEELLFFVFFSTLSSYSLHWFLTNNEKETSRIIWTISNRRILFAIFVGSSISAIIYFFYLISLWKIIVPLAICTFFYTAPKIPHPIFAPIRGFAFAKTLYLATVWLCVCVFLPLLAANIVFTDEVWLFAINRFLLILSICMVFDFRDRNEDYGIKNLITYFNEKKLLLSLSATFIIFLWTALFWFVHLTVGEWFALIFPMCLLYFSISISTKTKNDYWFYCFLDGIMLLSGIGLLLIKKGLISTYVNIKPFINQTANLFL